MHFILDNGHAALYCYMTGIAEVRNINIRIDENLRKHFVQLLKKCLTSCFNNKRSSPSGHGGIFDGEGVRPNGV